MVRPFRDRLPIKNLDVARHDSGPLRKRVDMDISHLVYVSHYEKGKWSNPIRTTRTSVTVFSLTQSDVVSWSLASVTIL